MEIVKNLSLMDYQVQAKRTLPDLGSLEKNQKHMFLGLITEIGELADLYKKELAYGRELDTIGRDEEWADIMWYNTNYYSLRNLIIPDITDPSYEYQSDIKDLIRTTPDPVELIVMFIPSFHQMIDQGDYNIMTEYLWELGEYIGVNREKALFNNIQKLKIRYPEKFTEENALNRDLKAERDQLSQ